MPSLRPRKTAEKELPAVRQSPCYVEPAPADEVMMEQLELLLLHSRKGPHLACAECARLDRIGAILLSPFL